MVEAAGAGAGRGPRARASAASGLPFAGIPLELQDGVDKLLAAEPEYAEPDVVFHRTPTSASSSD